MLPARSQAALRATRRASCPAVTRPTVIAATVGANTAPRTAMTMSTPSTTGRVGTMTIASAAAAKAADGQYHADRGLVPTRLPEQEDADIGPEPAAHVGEQEVDEVEATVERHRVPTGDRICRFHRRERSAAVTTLVQGDLRAANQESLEWPP